ncbi:MAG: M12 family metallopeptidase [Phycisphaerales bacterium]|nr:M12 family metallopeptidase [Phycisphaerales bacterium]
MSFLSLIVRGCRMTACLAPVAAVSLACRAQPGAAPQGPPDPPAPPGDPRGWTPEGLDPEVAMRPSRQCTTEPGRFSDRAHWQANLWPGGIVPYEFDANVAANEQTAMRAAMDELEAVCNVTFRPRAGEDPFVHIQDDDGNSSGVGRPGSGQRTINIFNWNRRFIMCHELMHTLGVEHEQSRNDRDTFVIITLANVCQDCCSGGSCNHNFDQAGGTDCGTYDFDSVMHYPGDAFSTNGMNTITARPGFEAFQALMGQRDHLSDGDIACLSQMYGAPFGACCAADSSCTSTQEAQCSGVWMGGDTACEPNPCTGACCSTGGACTITLAPDCVGFFRGVSVACGANTCAGACCSSAGACSISSATACNGIFRGTDTACGANTCPGACCSQAGDCTFVSAAACVSGGGTFRATDAPCEPLTCPGACCASSGECTFTSNTICASGGGSYRGLDRPCTPDECPGACCLLNRSCIISGYIACISQRGEYLGLDTTCAGEPCCCRPWDNGYADGRGGQASQIGAGEDWRPLAHVSFDDFWLCEGQVHRIEHASAVVSTNSATPKFIIAILPDCDGLPDITHPLAVAGLEGTIFEVDQEDVPFVLGRIEQDVHAGPDADGFSLIEAKAVFDAKRLVLRGGAYWITVFGVSATLNPTDEFFWQTAGNRIVRGRPGVFYDGETFRTSDELCCGCTDYNFCIEGDSCKILLDNGPPIAVFGNIHPTAIASLQNGGNIATKTRAADKLVLPPCRDLDICYIEGWMWTNCDRISLQFFRDGCHCPLDADAGTVLIDADCVMDTGITAQDNSGITITLKKAQFFFDPDMVRGLLALERVQDGNVWISLVGQGDNRQNARAYFAFGDRCDRPCDDGFGCFRAAPFDVNQWRSNDFPGTSIQGNDHALLVAIRENEFPEAGAGSEPPPPPPPPAPVCRGDFNGDGRASVQDLFDFLAVYFAGCP